jgi:diguanylate cyclase (GGDEF)-like protein
MGGDEFLVALAGVDTLADAVDVAEKVRRACAEPVVVVAHVSAAATVSIGVALQSDGEDAGDLMRRADRALYRAKAAGRDRVETDPQQPRRTVAATQHCSGRGPTA